MIDAHKAVFLPIDDRILNLYMGYVMNEKVLPELKKSEFYSIEYIEAREEDTPYFLDKCTKNSFRIYLYTYHALSQEKQFKLEKLIQSGIIISCQVISKISDLIPFINSEKISLSNSLLVIKDISEVHESNLLGFTTDGYNRNVELWNKGKSNYEYGISHMELNTNVTLREIGNKIEKDLIAKNKAFFRNDFILFLEDEWDEILNKYIEKNLIVINHRLSKKGMHLLYYPSVQLSDYLFQKPILDFIRYRLPVLYSFTDSELLDAIRLIVQKISPLEFYRMVLEELELPYFKRPCLLRNISGGSERSENRFTFQYIEYQTEKDLDNFFESYLQDLWIPEDKFHALAERNIIYNADNSFGVESKRDTEELKLKIDAIKAEGKFGVLAEAIMYMLESIKDEKPEILKKVKPFIEKNQLLESKVILSPVLIDNHYNIFLPDYGNIEVKMHALPKTVYILFLRHLEGIRFKELYEHKTELLEIYNVVTNKYDNEEIEKAIDDLVDMTKPSINQKCARIREAFRNIMDEHIARYYYIDGLNGQPKKISLPKNLIDIRY
jgi:hypothetical protein